MRFVGRMAEMAGGWQRSQLDLLCAEPSGRAPTNNQIWRWPQVIALHNTDSALLKTHIVGVHRNHPIAHAKPSARRTSSSGSSRGGSTAAAPPHRRGSIGQQRMILRRQRAGKEANRCAG